MIRWLRRLLFGAPCERHVWLSRVCGFRYRDGRYMQLEFQRTCQVCIKTFKEWRK